MKPRYRMTIVTDKLTASAWINWIHGIQPITRIKQTPQGKVLYQLIEPTTEQIYSYLGQPEVCKRLTKKIL